MSKAKLNLNGQDYEFDTFSGTENELAFDIKKLRAESTAITYDPGYGNTGSCKSAITFVDGEKGILRYRGYNIEDLVGKVRFADVAYLLIYGELPNETEANKWRMDLRRQSLIHESMVKFFDLLPINGHPMNILSTMVSAMSSFYPHDSEDDEHIQLNVRRLIGQSKTIAAYSYKKSIGQPFVYPLSGLPYAANFLRMMFATPLEAYEIPKELEEALDVLLILHADHEQNCSTSTVRMVGSSQANIYSAMSAGINALWGPLHGGANQAVIEMLERIHKDGGDHKKYMEMAKDKNSNFRLMGFGHRVYKNYDPRAKILRTYADEILKKLNANDPLLELAKNLEEVALNDDYFVERNLYPNVDFYSGIIYRAMNIPTEMFTVLFAIGRMPGWIAHFLEMRHDPDNRIHRPRQIYIGSPERKLTK